MTNILLMSFSEAQSLATSMYDMAFVLSIFTATIERIINTAKWLKKFLISQMEINGKNHTFSKFKKSMTKKLRKLILKNKKN